MLLCFTAIFKTFNYSLELSQLVKDYLYNGDKIKQKTIISRERLIRDDTEKRNDLIKVTARISDLL